MSEYKIENKDNLSIRTKEWYKNKGINISQKVIEETIRELNLKKCPVCEGELEHSDQFGTGLPSQNETQFKYCPNDNYIIEIKAHQYTGNTWGTNFLMRIHTNAMFSKTLADSGELADLKNEHVRLSF